MKKKGKKRRVNKEKREQEGRGESTKETGSKLRKFRTKILKRKEKR